MNESLQRERVMPLPASTSDLIAQRKLKQVFRSLNDQVEEFHLRLWQAEAYREYLDAVYDEDAVEGSLAADNLKAAEMIRDAATKSGNNDLGAKKLATIVKSLKIVKRRYNIDRRYRRETVGGERVRSTDNNDE